MLDMPNIRVLEVATFYTMFNLAPVGTSLRAGLRHDAVHAGGSDDIRRSAASASANRAT